jgi:hypothetical protein
MVGRTYTGDAVDHPNWFYESAWRTEEQREFQEWLARLGARTFGTPMKKARFRAGMFVLNYGWQTVDAGTCLNRGTSFHEAEGCCDSD